MRLPVENIARLVTLALALMLSGCGLVGGNEEVHSTQANGSIESANGPAADYPMVLGEPYRIDGIEYVPADVLNYDEVGYASADPNTGITASHRTLPLPSYVEVTSLETGKTILVRAERRGPMVGNSLIGLSTGAQEQLGASEETPVRVRRVNPPESDRALLRAGQYAPERLETPMSLVAVLKRKLPEKGSASLAPLPAVATNEITAEPVAKPAPLLAEAHIPAEVIEVIDPSIADPVPSLAMATSKTADPEAVLPAAAAPVIAVAEVIADPLNKPEPTAATLVVQAATFSVEENAKRAANALEGFVVPTGKFFRVRVGPYSSRGQADAALAKVKAAGYSDARVIDAG